MKIFYFSAFINKYCSSYLVIELCTGKVKHTDIYIYIYTVVAKSLATLENLLKKSKKLIKIGLMEYN